MPLTIFKRGKIWHYRGSVAGRKLRGSTKTADKQTAQRLAAEIEARYWKSRLDGPETVLTFANAANLYLDAGKSPRYVGVVAKYWKDTPVKAISSGAIRQSAIDIYPQAAGATRNRQAIVPAQAIINHAATMNLCQPVRVSHFPVDRHGKGPATLEWIEAFRASANPCLGALACFMFGTGARISEALSLTWDDIDFKKHRALIRQTKSGDDRWAHLQGPLFAAIASIQDREELVFKYPSQSTARRHWRAAIAQAGIEYLSFHACRHGFATALLHSGVDPITTAKLGGWKSPQRLFSTYGHAMDDKTVSERIFGTPQAHSSERIEKP